ncbi:hypothetical protein R3P38DRAFT_3245333 [Favolaschia claudopus]|uniref:Uncharacterized protein n=1 Tax=Favolaschia claudopus TaxID=2862362 RepID=A0AAV9Z0P6_9AGAR
MPPPRWSTPEQWQWLLDHITRYLEARANGTTTDFFTALEAEWFLKWPERHVLGLPTLASGQLRTWYRNNTKKARASGSVTAGKAAGKKKKQTLSDALWSDGRGHRGPQMVEVYQKMYGSRVAQAIQASNMESQASPETDFSLAGPSKPPNRRKTLMSTRRAVSQRLLATETEEVKRAVADERAKQKNKERTVTERTPESTQDSIDEMERVVPRFLDTVRDKTGLIGMALFGGPIPESGGKLGMKLYSSAHSASGYTFKDSHPDWKASVADYFAKYLRKCFTREEREAMALVLQRQDDSDFEEEQGGEPTDTQQQVLSTGRSSATSPLPAVPTSASTVQDSSSVSPSVRAAMANDFPLTSTNGFISGQLYTFPPPSTDPSISVFDDLGHEQNVGARDVEYGDIDLANMTPPGSEWSAEEWAGLLAQMTGNESANTIDVSTDSTVSFPLYSHSSSLLEALGNPTASSAQGIPTSTHTTPETASSPFAPPPSALPSSVPSPSLPAASTVPPLIPPARAATVPHSVPAIPSIPAAALVPPPSQPATATIPSLRGWPFVPNRELRSSLPHLPRPSPPQYSHSSTNTPPKRSPNVSGLTSPVPPKVARSQLAWSAENLKQAMAGRRKELDELVEEGKDDGTEEDSDDEEVPLAQRGRTLSPPPLSRPMGNQPVEPKSTKTSLADVEGAGGGGGRGRGHGRGRGRGGRGRGGRGGRGGTGSVSATRDVGVEQENQPIVSDASSHLLVEPSKYNLDNVPPPPSPPPHPAARITPETSLTPPIAQPEPSLALTRPVRERRAPANANQKAEELDARLLERKKPGNDNKEGTDGNAKKRKNAGDGQKSTNK